MIDPRLGWFAMGATFGLVLCGWPWHPRFGRYSRPAPRRPGHYSSSARGFPPPPPPPGTRREYLYSRATMAECGGPCWEFLDPRACDCGALWLDGVPWDEGRIQRGHGHGGPTTPKPEITPKPQPPGGRLIRDDWGPPSRPPATGGYYPVLRLHGETRNPPPDSPDSP